MKNKIWSLTIFLNVILGLDLGSNGCFIVEYFNYVCIVAVISMIIFCVTHHKKLFSCVTESSLRIQWSYVFLFILWGLMLICAVLDIFV